MASRKRTLFTDEHRKRDKHSLLVLSNTRFSTRTRAPKVHASNIYLMPQRISLSNLDENLESSIPSSQVRVCGVIIVTTRVTRVEIYQYWVFRRVFVASTWMLERTFDPLL